MSLFVVRHQHAAESCPATDPRMGAMLVEHVAPENAQAKGVTIQGEAVVNGAHSLYMIVEANDRQTVERFMAPFAQVGSVEVLAASTCGQTVAQGGCAMLVP